jgi:hypothetical protein
MLYTVQFPINTIEKTGHRQERLFLYLRITPSFSQVTIDVAHQLEYFDNKAINDVTHE